MYRSVLFLSLLCLGMAFPPAPAAAAQPKQDPFGDIGRILCVEGTERYLPGDYYFCAANKALQAGHAVKARAMYEEAARWGDKRAMFNLGLLLYRGGSLPQDQPLGLAWLALAAERKDDSLQREVLVAAWIEATPEIQDAANALWNGMKSEYADRFVLPRANERYEREIAQLRRELQRDPTMQLQLAGAGVGLPANGYNMLRTLDEAAAETILRPLPGRDGKVRVGAPETLHGQAPNPW